MPSPHPKPRLAVWKFASCDGCQLSLLDCEDELLAIAGALDIAYFPEATRGRLRGRFDLSLVEGSITTPRDRERIRQVRRRSRRLVTIGACATAGGIQALRNFADVDAYAAVVYPRPPAAAATLGHPSRLSFPAAPSAPAPTPPSAPAPSSAPPSAVPPSRPTAPSGRRRSASRQVFQILPTSTPIADHVRVDFELRGCPINKRQLVEVIAAFLAGRRPLVPPHSVCIECKLRANVCVLVARGAPCLGPVTHAGCGALCPAYDRGCYGCYGPKETPNPPSLSAWFGALGTPRRDLLHLYRTFNAFAGPFREESERHAG